MNKEKKCEFCGETFIPRANRQRYCKRKHYMNCPICGKQYEVTNNDNLRRPPVACSYACRVARTKQTCLEKYGTTAPGNAPEVIAKIRASWNSKSDDELKRITNKQIATMQKQYGVSNARYLQTEIAELIKYEKVAPKYKISNSDMHVFKLNTDVMLNWIKSNSPKHIEDVVCGYGLVKDDTIYQVIGLKVSNNCDEKVEIGCMLTLKEYEIIEGYDKLFRFITRDMEFRSVIAHVDNLYDDLDSYLGLGFQIRSTVPARYYHEYKGNVYSIKWKENHLDLQTKLLKDKGYTTVFYDANIYITN